MKIQYLTVIFILIIMPLVIVFSEYIDNQIETIQTEYEYDTRLFNATYDAIKAYQLNTVNNSFSDRPEDKVSEIEAAVSTFYNSLIMSFGYSGNVSSIMDDYVPAVIICLYDGYYIYSPYENVLTGLNTEDEDSSDYVDVDSDYENNASLDGVHPYIYYNCHYCFIDNYTDFTITYTLDNYITIDGYVNGDYIYESGYLIDRITNSGDIYIYDYTDVDPDDTKTLYEYYGDKCYKYTKIDGTKFYLSTNATANDGEVFYIDASGEKQIQASSSSNLTTYQLYYNAIEYNIDDYIYYRDAYEFTAKVEGYFSNLDFSTATITIGEDTLTLSTNNPFNGDYQYTDSDFNEHRQQVIRAVIETNLSVAISAYGDKYADGSTYIMPNISETDWELIENNVCIATFMQGLNIGGKVYNGYAVVANNLTKEYVDENDIYILTTDTSNGTAYYYTRANDDNLISSSSISISIGNETSGLSVVDTAGVLKVDLERRSYYTDTGTTYYFPYSTSKYSPYLGSYSGAVTGSSLNSILSIDTSGSSNSILDMYTYMESLSSSTKVTQLKEAYYNRIRKRENSNIQCTKWTL